MALQHSSGIVTSGMLFHYDMSNTQKSWKGEPVVNQFICPNPYDSNNNVSFNVQGTGTFQRVYSGTYGGYDIKPTDVVYRYDLGGSGCHYHGNSAAIASGQYVCYSVDYYISPDASDYPTNSSLVVLENYGGGALGGGTGVSGSNTVMGKWQTIQGYSGPTGSSGTQAMFLYPGGCGSTYMASRGFILMKNPMFEFRSNIKYNPFVNGTRSNTQTVVDLTGRSTATVGSMQYNSDGTFEYWYANPSYIQIPLSTAFNKTEGTINFWLYPTRYNGGNGYFVNREDSTANAVDWLWIGPYSDTFYFRLGNGSDCCSNDLSFGSFSANVPLNTWVNMCFTWKANGTSVIYKNGVQFTSRSIGNVPSTSPASNGRIGLGHGNADDYYNGKMPVVQIYNRQLSAGEVAQNFRALRGRYGI